jgi:diguanylate cyclase (GGDEF)-like protein/hemerythrin-like metal-binding protein
MGFSISHRNNRIRWIGLITPLSIVVASTFFASTFVASTKVVSSTIEKDETTLISLTTEEADYIKTLNTVTFCVDPDWYPYEHIDAQGLHKGIASDLISLISQRTGVPIELITTKDWNESIQYSKDKKCDFLSFLNETPERSKWLSFTEPYYTDPNVMITREEHDFISDVSRLIDHTVVLPEGTSVEERIRSDYPNLKIILVKTEAEAIEYVSERKADLTIRSLTMGAYVIKSQGLFNLKIAGQIPEYTNQFRIGVNKDKPMLRDILNKGIATITPEDVEQIVNKYIVVKIEEAFDYELLFIAIGVLLSVLLLAGLWNLQLRKYNTQLAARQEELTFISEQLVLSEERYKQLVYELEVKNTMLSERVGHDKLTGIKNRYYFDQRITEEVEQSDRYDISLSLLIFDLDLFKHVNDQFGHDMGDQVLIKLSECVKKIVRKSDVFARWGGEEFIVLMTQTDKKGAEILAEKIRQAVESIEHDKVGKVTISIGLATRNKEETIESWFRRADQALYRAKNEGRNRVCVSEADDGNVHLAIEWKPKWESGNEEIDRQHKELLYLGNQVIQELFVFNADEGVIDELDNLINHIAIHFETEEKILSAVVFDDFDNHKKCHNELLNEALRLKEQLMSTEVKPSEVIEFIVNSVIIGHLLKEDTKFFSLMKQDKATQNSQLTS